LALWRCCARGLATYIGAHVVDPYRNWTWRRGDVSLRHDAFVYDCDAAFVAAMGAHLAAGLRAGAHAVAITTRHNLGLLRESLGADADGVTCIDREEWYRHPANVLAGFDRVVRRAEAAGAPSVHAIGEVRFGTTPREWDRWTAYEATIDRALAGRKLNVICPYDERVLPAAVLDCACATHEHIITDARRPSTAYADAATVIRAHTPAPEPLPQLRDLRPPSDAHGLRGLLAAEMATDGVPDAAARDMLLAAGEVYINAARHGAGATSLRVGRVGTHFVCEITDAGPGLDDPLAGYLPPRPTQPTGAGLWVARQSTSATELLHPSTGGLTVRLWS
jgi:anti-sigma regulatory factor (Ser/Thr protein kinase)